MHHSFQSTKEHSDIQLQELHWILYNSLKQSHPPSFCYKCTKYWPNSFTIHSATNSQHTSNASLHYLANY